MGLGHFITLILLLLDVSSLSEMGKTKRTSTYIFRKQKALKRDVGYVEKRSKLCVMALNVNGLTQSSVHDIEAAIEAKKVDIVSVTETKCPPPLVTCVILGWYFLS